MRSVRRVVGGAGEWISKREEIGQSWKRVQLRTLSLKTPVCKIIAVEKEFTGAPSHEQRCVLRRMDSHTNLWHAERDAHFKRNWFTVEFKRRTELWRERRKCTVGKCILALFKKPLKPACVLQAAIKSATLAFRIATLHSFIPTHKHTSLLLLPVGLTMEPFPGGVARDTWSFPGVPSPLQLSFLEGL